MQSLTKIEFKSFKKSLEIEDVELTTELRTEGVPICTVNRVESIDWIEETVWVDDIEYVLTAEQVDELIDYCHYFNKDLEKNYNHNVLMTS